MKADEIIYDAIAHEIEQKRLVPGLWVKSYAEANGDTDKARALYIKYRFVQLVEQFERELAANQEKEREQNELNRKRDEEAAEMRRANLNALNKYNPGLFVAPDDQNRIQNEHEAQRIQTAEKDRRMINKIYGNPESGL